MGSFAEGGAEGVEPGERVGGKLGETVVDGRIEGEGGEGGVVCGVVAKEAAGSQGEEGGDVVGQLGGAGNDVLADAPEREAGVGARVVEGDNAVCRVVWAVEVGEPVVHHPVGGGEVEGTGAKVLGCVQEGAAEVGGGGRGEESERGLEVVGERVACESVEYNG